MKKRNPKFKPMDIVEYQDVFYKIIDIAWMGKHIIYLISDANDTETWVDEVYLRKGK